MKFRTLCADDIDLILAVQKDDFPDGWNREQILSGFNQNHINALCLEENDKPLGLIIYSVSIDVADIEGLVVVSTERRNGYGKILLERALIEIAEKGVKKVLLEVRESNFPAISLYKSCGFKEISIRKKYYADGENAVILIKEI